jgi:hypothetical protein
VLPEYVLIAAGDRELGELLEEVRDVVAALT